MSILCLKCGWTNPDGTEFCMNDGTYLKFDGEYQEDPVDSPPPVFEDPEADRPTFVQKVKTIIVGDDVATSVARPETPTTATPAPPPQDTSTANDAAAPPITPAASTKREPDVGTIAGLAVPEASGLTAAPPESAAQPGPSLPTEEGPKPVKPVPQTTPQQKFRPGDDIICTDCGWGNRSEQNFCRHCGHSLAEAAPVRVPWWRRLFQRKKQTARAGDHSQIKPRRKGRAGRVFRWSALAALAVVAILAIGPWRSSIGDSISNARERFLPKYETVTPSSVTVDGQPVPALTDGARNQWKEFLAPPAEIPSPLPALPSPDRTITVEFADPVHLAKLLITGGADTTEDFQRFARPKAVVVLARDANGQVIKQKQFTMQDERKAQTFDLEADGTKSVLIYPESGYLVTDNPRANMAISEVEFRTKH